MSQYFLLGIGLAVVYAKFAHRQHPMRSASDRKTKNQTARLGSNATMKIAKQIHALCSCPSSNWLENWFWPERQENNHFER
jgi:hypothetical protein